MLAGHFELLPQTSPDMRHARNSCFSALKMALKSPTCMKRFAVIGIILFSVSLVLLRWKQPSDAHHKESRNKRQGSTWHEDEKVVVFEEHHEALPYWFTAVQKGLIPAKNNILLHIDGHSDDAPPDITMGYPKFRFPRTKRELRIMMQENDIFVQAAAMTGMFKRFIWVWPRWDSPNHPDGEWLRGVMNYGETRVIGPEGEEENVYCACRTIVTEKDPMCFYYNKTMLDLGFMDKEMFQLSPEKCRIKGRYEWEEISEDQAVKNLLSGTWIKQDESLLIDIDEDFFGCQSAGQQLVDAGAPWPLVETIDGLVNRLVCPRRTEHEIPGEALLMPIVHKAIELCKNSNMPCVGYESQLQRFAANHLQTVMSKFPAYLCTRNRAVYTRRMNAFARHLLHFERSHLQALARTGICMMTTPKSSFFINSKRSSGTFQICHGFNHPNETVVLWYSPNEADVHSRLKRLQRMFVDGRYPHPKLVTVCRSIRDGYTPRNHFELIENGILDIFRSKLSHPYKVHFDLDLLGGQGGWPRLHKQL